jgi:hypothetical protein
MMKLILLILFLPIFCFGQTYIQSNSLIETPASTATANGTTTLTLTSQTNQRFTGVTTQSVVLPDATTLKNGRRFEVQNDSTGTVTVKYNDATTAVVLLGLQRATLTLESNGTTNGTWTIFGPNSVDVTIGTANGLSVSGQALSMAQANGSTTGALSSGDWTTFNSKGIVNSITAGTNISIAGGATATPTVSTVATPTFTQVNSSTYKTSTGATYINADNYWIQNSGGALLADFSGSVPTLWQGFSFANSSFSPTVIFKTNPAGSAYTLQWPTNFTAGLLYTDGNNPGQLFWGSVTGTAPITVSAGSSTPVIGIPKATSSTNGYLASADWTTFNGKGSGTVTQLFGTGPVTVTNATTTPTISMAQANGSTSGYLSSTDWTTFNNHYGTVTQLFGTGPVTVTNATTTPTISMAQANGSTNGYLASADWTTFNGKGSGTVTQLFGGTNISVTNSTTTPTISITGSLAVANGGTGRATLTNHAVLVGATTNAISQVGPDPSTTKVLVSAGSSADPAFSAMTPAILLHQGQILTSTFTTASDSSSSTIYYVKICGGGGGGGGSNGASAGGGGGGAGGYAEGTITGIAASTTVTITTGAGGTAGSSAGGNGGAGGNSSIAATGISTITAAGGSGGTGTTGVTGVTGGAGGGVTNPLQLAFTGGTGAPSFVYTGGGTVRGGDGASSPLGFGGYGGAANVSGVGIQGWGYCSGGSGGIGSAATGGVGASGIVMVIQLTP